MVTLVPQQGEKAVGASNVQLVPHSAVLLVGQLIPGGVVLTTVIVWLQVLELPQQSIATQVWVMNCGQRPLVTVWLHVAVAPTQSTICQVRVINRGQVPLVTSEEVMP